MAIIKTHCDHCQAIVDLRVGQFVDGTLLRWNAAYHCLQCGNTIEYDGTGEPPAAIKQALLAHEGVWELLIASRDIYLPELLKAMRTILKLSLAETAAIRAQLPVLVAGRTRADVEHVQALLQTAGIATLLRQKH
jgi:hypothetical protein